MNHISDPEIINKSTSYFPHVRMDSFPSLLSVYIMNSDKILFFPIFVNIIILLVSFYHFESLDDNNFDNFIGSILYSLSLAINFFFNCDFFLKIMFYDEVKKLKHYKKFIIFIDGISGPIALILNFYLLFDYSEFTLGILHCCLASKFFNFLFIRKLLIRIYEIIPLILPLFFYVFAIIYLFSSLSMKHFKNLHYEDWGYHMTALFVSFQAFTFDEWGKEIKSLLDKVAVFQALLMIFLVIFGAIFVMNFLYACAFDVLTISKELANIPTILEQYPKRLYKYNSFFVYKLIAGCYYSYFMTAFLIICFAKDAFELNEKSESYKIFISMSIILFNYHFFLHVFYIQKKWDQMKHESKTRMKLTLLFNLVCGPVAQMLLIYGLYTKEEIHEYLNSILILKFFTIGQIKHLIFDNLKVAVQLFPILLFIFVFCLFLAFLAADLFNQRADSFGDLNLSFITVIQIITLVAWKKHLDHDQLEIASFFEVSLIIIFQWGVICIMVAHSCNVMRYSYYKLLKLEKIFPCKVEIEECSHITKLNKAIAQIEKIEIINHFFLRNRYKSKIKEVNKYLNQNLSVEDSKTINSLAKIKKLFKNVDHSIMKIEYNGKKVEMQGYRIFRFVKLNDNIFKSF